MSKQFIDVKLVKDKARGKWLQIIASIAPFFSEASERVGVHHTCPIHGGLDGFRFYKDAHETGGGICNSCGNFPDGIALLSWATNKGFYETLKDVADVVGGSEFVAKPVKKVLPQNAKNLQVADTVKRLRLRSAFTNSIRATAPGASLLRNYFTKERGLENVPDTLRLHPSMAYRHDNGKVENFPTILAMVYAPDGTPVTMHRTYLDPDTGKKANVSSPKKVMSLTSDVTLKGAAIRLYPATGDTLCIAEGIETAIAVHEATGLPAWSSISSTFMDGFIPPENVKRLIVFADKDRSQAGLMSARKLVENLIAKGIDASIQLPPSEIPDMQKGIDWLDELLTNGKAAFQAFA